MTQHNKDSILSALKNIPTPDGQKNIVAAGVVTGLTLAEGENGQKLFVALEIPPDQETAWEKVREKAEKVLRDLGGVTEVSVVLTAHRKRETTKSASRQNETSSIKKVIAVASGKGGVGKSTVAVNLAIALSQKNLKIGLLDADIYGPSVPRMLGVSERPEMGLDDKIIPLQAHDISFMSIGAMVGEDDAMIWRGPMVHGALQQLAHDVAWGDLDILIVDLPPGTGDAQLSIAKLLPLSGAVIVSTPQDIALLDARRGIAMFQKIGVKILGLVENMSYFLCPHCGERTEIFSHGGAEHEARYHDAPFLGAIPLDIAIRETSDNGAPIVASQPKSAQAETYKKIATQIADQVFEARS